MNVKVFKVEMIGFSVFESYGMFFIDSCLEFLERESKYWNDNIFFGFLIKLIFIN